MKYVAKYLILLLFIISFPARADGPAHWTVRDIDTTIHLFGTIHALPHGIEWQSEQLMADFDSAQYVIFELTPAQFSWNVMFGAMRTKGLFHNDDNLGNYLDKKTLNKVVRLLRKKNVPSDYLLRIKPWFAEEIISNSDGNESQLKRKYGVEAILVKRAKGNRQYINGLESASKQMNISAGLKMKDQVKYLEMALDRLGDKPTIEADVLVKAWQEGNMDFIENISKQEFGEFPALYKRMLPDRNKDWVKQFPVFMEMPGTIFIAVGAAHMPGEGGVINLLKKAGYAVERIN